ncbi:MATE family efflux transporter [Clostridium sp. MSJ-8]|uniref:MATE family efflux transporter n=1 Tax=Clostridium sp. MSJ-8 TaxID=2841510 RepID=UPI001C0ED786|nr:MATE family efflux transporter [Clostridium sp. MSJ-8]MBU5488737.1 MATE family efflux transporter [Clostridium sp. MSJ-8]
MEKQVLKSEIIQQEEARKFGKKLFKICWPLFIELALTMLLGSVDTFMLGRYSDNAVAAVGVVNQVMNMVLLVFQIITTGTTIICAQYIGAKLKEHELFKIIGSSISLNFVLGIIFSIAMVVFATPILRVLNLDSDLMALGKSYMVIVGSFSVIQAMNLTFSAVIRSYGNTKMTMIATLVMNMFNIIGNYTLIYGKLGAPELGITGAAISTSVSKVIGTIILVVYLFKVLLKNFKFKYIITLYKAELKKILTVGLPSAGESIAYNSAKLMCTVILTHISIVALTTNNYINNIAMYIYIFSTSLGQGTAIIIGQLVGEGREDEAYKLCFSSLKKAFIASTTLAIIVALLGKQIFGIFTDNADIIELGSTILFINIILETGRTFNVVVINCLRAAGDVRFPVYIGIVSMWVIGVGVSYVLAIPCKLGFPGMWLALAMDEWTRGIIMCFRWRSKKWHGRALV